MNKFLIVLFTSLVGVLQAQNVSEPMNFKSIGEVEYVMYIKFKNIDPYLATLYFNQSKSLYDYRGSTTGEETVEEGNRTVTYIKDTTSYKVLLNKETDLLYSKSNDKYYVYEEVPKMEWTLLNETKMFKQVKCLKASTTFRGRKYYAWYAPSISSSFGPWKLNGLPGLILEAFDESEDVVFRFKSLTIPKKETVTFYDHKLKVVKLLKYVDARKKGIQEMLEIIRARDKKNGTKSKISGGETIELNYYDVKKN